MARDFFLKTSRMGFSKWSPDDTLLAELLWGDPLVTKYICADGVLTKAAILQRLETEIRNAREHGVQYWPVFSLEVDELVGCCGLRPHGESEYEIGFHLRPQFWGQGYAEEAATAVIRYAFSTLHAKKLFAGHNPHNIASEKLLKKLDFTYIGDEYYVPTGLQHPSYELRDHRPVLLDITLKITPATAAAAQKRESKALTGHLGTHFDVMNKVFPLEYTKRNGIIFDVSKVCNRDIEAADIDMNKVERHMFVAFYTGFIEREAYGSKNYFAAHPQLSNALIDLLVEKGISIIGIDFAGIRRGKEHTPKDQYCADKGVFIIENLCNLKAVLQYGDKFTAHTYPMNYADITGLPCRVIAECAEKV